MQRLTKIGVAVGSVGITIIPGLLAMLESNPFHCQFNEFMCDDPPIKDRFFLPGGILITMIGNALVLLEWRKSNILHKNQV